MCKKEHVCVGNKTQFSISLAVLFGPKRFNIYERQKQTSYWFYISYLHTFITAHRETQMTTIGVKNHRMKILFFYSSTSEYDRAMKSSLTRGKQQGHSVGDLGATMHVNKTTMARAEVVRSSDSPQLSPLRHVGALRTRTTAVHLTTEALLRSQTLGTSRLQSTSTHRLGIFRFRAGLLYFCGTDSGFALAERPFSSPRRRGRC